MNLPSMKMSFMLRKASSCITATFLAAEHGEASCPLASLQTCWASKYDFIAPAVLKIFPQTAWPLGKSTARGRGESGWGCAAPRSCYSTGVPSLHQGTRAPERSACHQGTRAPERSACHQGTRAPERSACHQGTRAPERSACH